MQENIALVFSGGSANGFAYIGVLKFLEEHQITAKLTGGTSAGSIFSAMLAAGYNSEEMLEYCTELQKKLPKIKDFSWKNIWKSIVQLDLNVVDGLIKGDKIQREITTVLQRKGVKVFADFRLPFYLHTINLDDGRDVYLDSINKENQQENVADWIRASISIPGIFIPKKINGEHYIDGGVKSNYPLLTAVEVAKTNNLQIDTVVSVSIKDDCFTNEFNLSQENLFDIMQRTMKLVMDDQYQTDHDIFRERYAQQINLMEIQIPPLHSASNFDVDIEKLVQHGYDSCKNNQSKLF